MPESDARSVEHVLTLESQRVSLAGSQGVSHGVACEGRAWSAWVPGDRYVLGFASALRFLLSQILYRLCKSPSDESRNRGPPHAERSPTHVKRSSSPCQSSMDYGNVKITQNALKVSEPSECSSWTLYGGRTAPRFDSASALLFV